MTIPIMFPGTLPTLVQNLKWHWSTRVGVGEIFGFTLTEQLRLDRQWCGLREHLKCR